jgi:hypothetical protein
MSSAPFEGFEIGTDEVLRMLLMYFVLPVWLAAGFADYLCSHRHLRPEQSDQRQAKSACKHLSSTKSITQFDFTF